MAAGHGILLPLRGRLGSADGARFWWRGTALFQSIHPGSAAFRAAHRARLHINVGICPNCRRDTTLMVEAHASVRRRRHPRTNCWTALIRSSSKAKKRQRIIGAVGVTCSTQARLACRTARPDADRYSRRQTLSQFIQLHDSVESQAKDCRVR